jgi:hypothetical protein
MEMKDKDPLRPLFAGMSDEPLPLDFNAKVMNKVRQEAVLQEKRHKRMEIFGYVSGAVAMIAVCVLVFYYYDISFELPRLEFPRWNFPTFEQYLRSFPKPDFELFRSPSFLFSLYIGIAALFLLIVDSTIRRKIEKNKK